MTPFIYALCIYIIIGSLGVAAALDLSRGVQRLKLPLWKELTLYVWQILIWPVIFGRWLWEPKLESQYPYAASLIRTLYELKARGDAYAGQLAWYEEELESVYPYLTPEEDQKIKNLIVEITTVKEPNPPNP